MKKDLLIKNIKDKKEKANLVEEILLGLPEWFGLEESRNTYINESKNFYVLAAKYENKNIGFISLKETSSDTCEIYCMGVKKKYHNLGVGKKLFNSFENYAKNKYKYIQVKTVDEGNYEEYDKTVGFYKSV